MDDLNEEQRQQALDLFEKKQFVRHETGKFIVFAIAGINIIGAALNLLANGMWIVFAISLIISCALFLGVVWVKYFYILVSFGMIGFMAGIIMETDAANHPAVFTMAVIAIAYYLVGILILIFNKNVREFLYGQKYK